MQKLIRVFNALCRRDGQPVRKSGVAMVAWLAIAVIAPPAVALNITTENNPPFNYQDGQSVTGLSSEILLEMGRHSGIPLNIQVLPWARAYRTALIQPDTCVYSTVRLAEREASFKWVGPLSVNKWALFAKSDFNKSINTIDDAKTYRIGGVNMDAKSMYLQSIGFANIDLIADDSLNLSKLIAGRIDLWITGLYRVKEFNDQARSKAIKPVWIVREVEYFLACNLNTSDATINALTQALQMLREQGYIKAVTDRYADRTH